MKIQKDGLINMVRIIIAILLVSFSVLAPLWAPSAVAGETLVLSTINNKVKKFVKRYDPLAQYLEQRLADQGVDAVEVSINTNRESLVEGLQSGHVDVYFDSPLIFASVARETGLQPALRSWKKGVAEYHSVIFTKASSSIETLNDLQGRIIAFEEPTSTSGYLLPKSELINAGYRLWETASRGTKIHSKKIAYLFSTDDNNTVLWVMKGKVAAGVVDSVTFEDISARRPTNFRVVARSESVPRQVVGLRAGLDPAVASALTEVLLEMHTTETGRT
ncbi:MAG: phosphate/phosphite/phosphonate ABC transporter substrate-binding protein, partial [Alphaproteobacteria bacterium]|nr:phosphate/phosphite/phosphonate ABC transporter substrate-binding protein [Alphaproteobacteria bacterium]